MTEAEGSGRGRTRPARPATRFVVERRSPPLRFGASAKVALRGVLGPLADAVSTGAAGGSLFMPIGPFRRAADLVGETAAIADACGAIVEEDVDGWSAVEPFPACWKLTPGACWAWRATLVAGDREFDGMNGLRIDYMPACTGEALKRLASFSWRLETRDSRDGRLREIAYRPI